MLLKLLLASKNKKETIRKLSKITLFYQRRNFCKTLVLPLTINFFVEIRYFLEKLVCKIRLRV